MEYTLENVYILIGREDKVGLINFKINSEAFKNFGHYIVGQIIYIEKERKALDKSIAEEKEQQHGKIKVEYLNTSLSEEKVQQLRMVGFNSEDILSIWFHNSF